MSKDDQLKQANRDAQQKLEAWNRFIENSLDGVGFVDPVTRQAKLAEWAEAENRAGFIRKQKEQ